MCIAKYSTKSQSILSLNNIYVCTYIDAGEPVCFFNDFMQPSDNEGIKCQCHMQSCHPRWHFSYGFQRTRHLLLKEKFKPGASVALKKLLLQIKSSLLVCRRHSGSGRTLCTIPLDTFQRTLLVEFWASFSLTILRDVITGLSDGQC